MKLDLLDERKGHPKYNLTQYRLKCVEEIAPADGYELILVPTSTYQTGVALEQLAPPSGQATFLILSSNWEGVENIDRILPRQRYQLGYPDGGGTIRDGVYWTNLGAEVHLGLMDSQLSEKFDRVKTLFLKADMQPDLGESVLISIRRSAISNSLTGWWWR